MNDDVARVDRDRLNFENEKVSFIYFLEFNEVQREVRNHYLGFGATTKWVK